MAKAPRETKWSANLLKQIKQANGLVLSIHGHNMQAPGWPDAYIAHAYWSGWIEFKGQKTVLQPLQKRIIEQLNGKGIPAYVVRYPNLIQHVSGVLLARFELETHNDGVSLIHALRSLEEAARRNVPGSSQS